MMQSSFQQFTSPHWAPEDQPCLLETLGRVLTLGAHAQEG